MNNIFHNYLAQIDEAYDDDRWSPMMSKALRSSSVEREQRLKQKERDLREFKKEEEKREKEANKFYNKFNVVTRDQVLSDKEERAKERRNDAYRRDMDRFKNKLNDYLENDNVKSLYKEKLKKRYSMQDADDRKLFQKFVNEFFALLDRYDFREINHDLQQLYLNELYRKFLKK